MRFNGMSLIFGLFLALPSLSMAWLHRPGMLTDDYGVVSSRDLDEEERKVDVPPFPPSRWSPFHYWQCLPTVNIVMRCDGLGFTEPEYSGKEIGEPVFQLRTEKEVFQFYTRRNYTLASCEEMIERWRSVISGESIICISASYLGASSRDLGGGRLIRNSDWEIDRMKSHHGEWSWFSRDSITRP